MLLLAAPSVSQIEAGVQWALQQKRAGKPVYVHCAHGESAAERMQTLSSLLYCMRTQLNSVLECTYNASHIPHRTVALHSTGHGRSNVMLCAAMVAEGTASSFTEAHSIVRRARPKCGRKRMQSAPAHLHDPTCISAPCDDQLCTSLLFIVRRPTGHTPGSRGTSCCVRRHRAKLNARQYQALVDWSTWRAGSGKDS